MESNRRRRSTAVLLSLLYPGLGHLYVRSWHRALGWYLGGLAGLGLLFAVTPGVTAALVASQSIDAAVRAARELPVDALVVVVLGLRLLGSADVWWVLRRRARGMAPTRCDSCARERESDLNFCPWCLDATDRDADSSRSS